MNSQNDNRSVFDWLIFTLIHLVVIGAISIVGFYVYGPKLAVWVASSATVAGLASCYLFAKDVPGETLMKCWLYLCVAANAGYLAHNGAQKIGVEGYNAAQVEKFERGMAEAGKATSRRVARELRLGAESASRIERTLSDGVSVIVAILAFLELASALMIFAISARRLRRSAKDALYQQWLANHEATRDRFNQKALEAQQQARDLIDEFRGAEIEVRPTGKLDESTGKVRRR